MKKENESLKTSLDNSLTKISQLEEELKRSKKYLDESRHFGHVGNWHWSLESNELRWLDEVDNINGQDPKQPNSPLAEMSIYYTPESWEKLNETVKKSSATSDSYELELEMIRPDGKIIHTITSGTADYSSAGKLLNLYGMVRDITARGKSEETLQWNQSLLQLMSNTSPLGLLVVDNRTDILIRVFVKSGEFYTLPREYILANLKIATLFQTACRRWLMCLLLSNPTDLCRMRKIV